MDRLVLVGCSSVGVWAVAFGALTGANGDDPCS
jgi:hypothetical protein